MGLLDLLGTSALPILGLMISLGGFVLLVLGIAVGDGGGASAGLLIIPLGALVIRLGKRLKSEQTRREEEGESGDD